MLNTANRNKRRVEKKLFEDLKKQKDEFGSIPREVEFMKEQFAKKGNEIQKKRNVDSELLHKLYQDGIIDIDGNAIQY